MPTVPLESKFHLSIFFFCWFFLPYLLVLTTQSCVACFIYKKEQRKNEGKKRNNQNTKVKINTNTNKKFYFVSIRLLKLLIYCYLLMFNGFSLSSYVKIDGEKLSHLLLKKKKKKENKEVLIIYWRNSFRF